MSGATPTPMVSLADTVTQQDAGVAVEHTEAVRLLLDGESRWDQRLIHWSNWLNPILVKETRQALKSKQFIWTFYLLILIVIIWTLLAIWSSMPNIYYESDGSVFLTGYLLILLIPAMIVIPQATFRSMASELDDGTYETLTLSLLRPWQVVFGKLTVAMLQLIIYLSILAPCIALTYLLQGVTLESIAAVLLILSTTSIALCTVAILLASLSRTRTLQVLFSVIMLGLQLIVAGMTLSMIFSMLAIGTLGNQGWTSVGLGTLAMAAYGWLFMLCASSAIGMASENRSTPIRIALFAIGMVIPMCGGFLLVFYSGQMGASNGQYYDYGPDYGEMVALLANLTCVHWGIAGAWLMGESGVITHRARRTLPASFPARLFLTWFNPGAGPGYFFVVLSFIGPLVALITIPWILHRSMDSSNVVMHVGSMAYCAALTAYLALYLGCVRLLMLVVFRKRRSQRLLLAFGSTFVLILFSIILSCSASLYVGQYRDMEFLWFCFINPFWSLTEFFPYSYQSSTVGMSGINGGEKLMAWVWLMISSGIVFVINAIFASRDVMVTRIETPQRVLRERTQLLPEIEPEFDQL